MSEYRAGICNEPVRKSDRRDGLCSKHAPLKPAVTAPPRKRVSVKTAAQALPKLPEPPSHYCPACMREFWQGNNSKPTRKSHREDKLCISHALSCGTATRKRRAPPELLVPRKRYRVRTKSPAQLYQQARRKCIEVDCTQRARSGLRCPGHHRLCLAGIPGMKAACRCLEDHKDKHSPYRFTDRIAQTKSIELRSLISLCANSTAGRGMSSKSVSL